MSRRRAPRPLSAALERLSADLAPPTTLARVQSCWDEVAGPVVGAEAVPASEQGGTVTVRCSSAVWANELALLETDLRERLNAAITSRAGGPPPVRSLRFSAASRARVTRGNAGRL